MRTGFFHNFRRKEVLVKKWDKYHEGNSSIVLNNRPSSLVSCKKIESTVSLLKCVNSNKHFLVLYTCKTVN